MLRGAPGDIVVPVVRLGWVGGGGGGGGGLLQVQRGKAVLPMKSMEERKSNFLPSGKSTSLQWRS